MGNTSLIEVVEEIERRLGALGLHLEGPIGFHGAVSAPDQDQDDDDDDDDDDDEVPYFDNDAFIDSLKNDEAFVAAHMNFAVNKLAWTDRILHPETYVSPEAQDDMGLPTAAESRQSEVARRISEGEELPDILRSIMDPNAEEE